MHFARSRTIWLLLSLGAALAVLAWSAQVSGGHTLHGAEATCATYTWGGAMHPTVTVAPCVAGRVQLRRLP